MQSADFLGGKYQQSEQILPGPVQTFRAQETSTGRPVFVHRMSTTEDPAQQIVLLRLLSLALLRSASARSLVVDLSDEGSFWYVVTQSDHRCLLLREWLQMEIDQAAGQGEVSVKRETVEPEMPIPAPPVAPEPAKPEPAPVAPPKMEAPKPEAPKNEPGEFTRFFQGGLPPPKKSSQQEAARGQDRPSNPDMRPQDRPTKISGFVQRPNTPVPQSAPRSPEPGEFTKIFSRPGTENAGNAPHSSPSGRTPSGTLLPESPGQVSGGFSGTADFGTGSSRLEGLPDSESRKSDLLDMFSTAPGISSPPPSPSKEPGEYTRIFGKGTVPPVQQPSRVATQQLPAFDQSLMGGAHEAPPTSTPPVPKGPSEYTRVMQGSKPGEASITGAGATGRLPALGVPPVPVPKVNIPKANLPGVGSVPMPMPPKPQAPPLPAVAAPVGINKKLIIFLSILGVLAVLLVILFVVAMKK